MSVLNRLASNFKAKQLLALQHLIALVVGDGIRISFPRNVIFILFHFICFGVISGPIDDFICLSAQEPS